VVTFPMPDANKVTAILENLFDGLAVKPGKAFELVEQKAMVGVYVSDGGQPVAACAMDLSLSAVMGSALSMLPPTVCKEAITNSMLNDSMKENLKEIMNICSRLLMDDFSAHLKLGSMHPARGLPRNAAVMLTEVHHRAHFHLSVPRYGGGYLTVMSV
jgi:hypothetical protein